VLNEDFNITEDLLMLLVDQVDERDQIHNKNDFIENKSIESLIRFVMKDLSKNIDDEIKSMKGLMSGLSKLNIFILKFASFKL
jgi:hypothetical protein